MDAHNEMVGTTNSIQPNGQTHSRPDGFLGRGPGELCNAPVNRPERAKVSEQRQTSKMSTAEQELARATLSRLRCATTVQKRSYKREEEQSNHHRRSSWAMR